MPPKKLPRLGLGNHDPFAGPLGKNFQWNPQKSVLDDAAPWYEDLTQEAKTTIKLSGGIIKEGQDQEHVRKRKEGPDHRHLTLTLYLTHCPLMFRKTGAACEVLSIRLGLWSSSKAERKRKRNNVR